MPAYRNHNLKKRSNANFRFLAPEPDPVPEKSGIKSGDDMENLQDGVGPEKISTGPTPNNNAK